ncbi:hypothetical protein ACFS27_07155 [Promicromonospora vindobonensis]|uniref:LPXTG-motif cell wall-anchored protein n=1 Tax=Promicromonospora vindobonensis TaxID=195748 RepID=A0ABW5VQ00_9MICO
MRKMTVLGASALLVAGLMATPAAAFATPVSPDNADYLDGVQVCEGYDSGKIDVNDNVDEVKVEAPAGQLISGYCVKAGSEKQGEGEGGAYFVELDEPTASVTITYPWGGGRDVSHYALVYTDAPTVPSQEPTEEPTEGPTDEPTDEPTTPGEEPTDEPTTPGEEPTDEPTTPGEEPTDEPTTPGEETTDEPTTEVTEPADGSAAPAEDDATPSPSAAAEAPGALAATGASTVIGFTLIALALVGGGVTLIVLRRKGVLGS